MNQLDSFCVTSPTPHAMEEAKIRVIEGDRLVLRWTGEQCSNSSCRDLRSTFLSS